MFLSVRSIRCHLLVVFAIILLVAPCAMADYEPDYRLSGFATLGLVTSDHDSLGFRRDLNQESGVADGEIDWKTDSLVGLQWQARWSPSFDATL